MKNLENNLLFKSINKNDLPLLLKCLQANKITYQKDQTIIHQGQSINEIGILLSGKAHIINDDYWGNQTIIKEIDIGELFGEAYAFLPKQNTMISIVAKEKCEILYLNISKIILSIKQYSSVGLVLTAKSIARYNKIAEDQKFAEYYLLGTLLSTICVLVVSLI